MQKECLSPNTARRRHLKNPQVTEEVISPEPEEGEDGEVEAGGVRGGSSGKAKLGKEEVMVAMVASFSKRDSSSISSSRL